MASPVFIEIFQHIIFASEIPAARKMVEFLEAIHILKCTQMSSTDVKINYPVARLLALLDTVELQGIHDALVLRT